MSNILMLIPPYVLAEDGKGVLPHKAMLPVGPLIVAGLLRDRGHDVRMIDLTFNEEWKNKLGVEMPDILLLSCHTLRNIPVCISVLKFLKEFWSGLPYTVLGGNACLENIRAPFLKNGLEVSVVRTFAHSEACLMAIEQKKSREIFAEREELEDLPLPALDLLPPDVYGHYHTYSGRRYPMYGFGLGCHWSCSYCSAKMGQPFIARRIERALREVEIARLLGYEEIWCVDNLILTNPEAALVFDQAVKKQSMAWRGMTRAEVICKLPERFLDRLTALKEVAMGVESLNDGMLLDFKRGGVGDYRENLESAFKKVGTAGIDSNAFVILDLPGTGVKDFWNLFHFLKRLRPSTVSWSFYNPSFQEAFISGLDFKNFGFYRWPLGYSSLVPEMVVQQAIILSGTWWDKWSVDIYNPYYEERLKIGVNFLEGRIVQRRYARDAAGDIWHTWKKGRRK